jgi:hypothetical protein
VSDLALTVGAVCALTAAIGVIFFVMLLVVL